MSGKLSELAAEINSRLFGEEGIIILFRLFLVASQTGTQMSIQLLPYISFADWIPVNSVRPDSLETTAPYKFITYLLTY